MLPKYFNFEKNNPLQMNLKFSPEKFKYFNSVKEFQKHQNKLFEYERTFFSYPFTKIMYIWPTTDKLNFLFQK